MAYGRSVRRDIARRNMRRRDFLKVSGGVAGAAMLGGCAGFGGGEEAGGGGSGELVFAFGENELLPTLFKQFEKDKGIKVSYQIQPADTGQYFDKLRTEFQAGTGAIDVIAGDVIWPAQFAASGYITDLSDKFTNPEDYLDGPIQANTYQGKLYGVPFFTDAGMLYYQRNGSHAYGRPFGGIVDRRHGTSAKDSRGPFPSNVCCYHGSSQGVNYKGR